ESRRRSVRAGRRNYSSVLDSCQSDYSIAESTTAAVFLYLPRPPMDPALHTDYLEKLDILTKDLPPTVMVHGLHKVVSRNL
ncbi:hypothetical protein BOX15_Mlig021753g2, partial [Macrostomum lignano]